METQVLMIVGDIDWGHMDGGWMIAMALFWGFVIVLVVWLLLRGLNRGPAQKAAPLEILERRFAEGEITAEEYRERRGVLEESKDR